MTLHDRLPQVSIALAGDQAAQHDRVGEWLWRDVEPGPLTSRRPRMPVQPVLGQPDGDGREPRVEGPVLVVLIEVCVGTNERVLRHLFGSRRIAHHHQDQAKQPALVTLHQMGERLTIAAADGADGVAIGSAHARV